MFCATGRQERAMIVKWLLDEPHNAIARPFYRYIAHKIAGGDHMGVDPVNRPVQFVWGMPPGRFGEDMED